MSAITELQTRFDKMKEAGLSDMKFHVGEKLDCTVEEFCAEVLMALDAIEAGNYEPLNLGDSYRTADDFEEWWGSTSASTARTQTKCRLKATAYAAWNHQAIIMKESTAAMNNAINAGKFMPADFNDSR